MKIIGDISNTRILILQGPMGIFFRKLDTFFTLNGAVTYKICFNAGDYAFSKAHNRIAYRSEPAYWSTYLNDFLITNKISKIFLFGNCRYYHYEAIKVAKKVNVEVFVFEEGYIRPNFITLERNGVNGDSNIPQDPLFYTHIQANPVSKSEPANNNHIKMGLQAGLYYILNSAFKPFFPYYRHHRDSSAFKELFYAIRNATKKPIYKITEKPITSRIKGELKKKYYFVPLQTRTDFQIKNYSPYTSIKEFIQVVLFSFAQHSPPGTSLLIKHHPMERGMSTYVKFIDKLSHEYGIKDRVIVVFDVHLPTCLKNAIGTITINSTVGLSSLFHNTPTITLGKAVYDIEGLTCQGMCLDKFWEHYQKPNRTLFLKFRSFIISETQLNGGFYGKFPDFTD